MQPPCMAAPPSQDRGACIYGWPCFWATVLLMVPCEHMVGLLCCIPHCTKPADLSVT